VIEVRRIPPYRAVKAYRCPGWVPEDGWAGAGDAYARRTHPGTRIPVWYDPVIPTHGVISRAPPAQWGQAWLPMLAAAGITLDTLLTRIKNENVNLPAGVIKIGQNEYGIRTNELYTSPAAIADMVITAANGVPVRLRDVATVHDAIQEQRVFSRINGAPSVLLSITAQPDANIVSVADALSERFAQISQRYPSIRFTTLLDQRVDPCMSDVFPWQKIPYAHELMRTNRHKPGNMAVLVNTPKLGLRNLEDVIEAVAS